MTGLRAGETPQRARRLLLDVAVVVIGILIAFALDSWWSGRAEANRERAHLRALRADFAENVARLEGAAAFEDAIVSASRELLVLGRSAGRAPFDTVRTLMGRVFNSARFEPVMGAYEAVVSTGGLAQISDDSLRTALASFAPHLRAPYVEEYSNSLYFPFVREYADRLGFLWSDATAGASASDGVQREARGYVELLHDRRFQAQVSLRLYAERDVGRYYRALQAQAREILAMLERELSR